MSLSQRAQDLLPSFETAPDLYRIPSKGETDVARRLSESGPETLGVALQLSQTGQLDAVAFATSSRVYFVPAETMCTDTAMKGLEAFFSESSSCILAGFGMARLALHIHRCTGVHMRAVDLSTLLSISTRESWPPSKVVYERMDSQVNRSRINALWLAQGDINICLRAWISACIAERFLYQVQCANKVDTRCLNIEELRCLEGLLINAELLEAAAPAEWENDFESISLEDGHYKLVNARYKSRVRASEQTEIVMETTCGRSVVGKAVGANGKSTKIAFRGPFRGEINLKSVRVVGREEATNAERAREEFVLLLLLGHFQLQTSRFIQMLWFPNEDVLLPLKKLPIASVNSFAELNRSQATVAEAMSSESIPLVIVHGPPGTGKTSTIAAAVQSWVANEESAPTWIIAQSNVGVKNIAESLLKRNIDFKLIVSKEFHFEWHEHLYDQLENHLVRSDDLGRDLVGTERLLGGSEVMLCTLSMLSNPALDTAGVYRAVPVERLVVDEASQIDTFDFMHLFHKFKNLEKVCLFGDPKQLPPYGQDIAPDMKSIFELKHLRQHAYFLNIQYRMPIPLGNFISGEVYDSKLLSEHRISAFSAVAFVDVKKGRESGGRSKENMEEVHTVVNLVREYYAMKDFCVITPYDAQRKVIQDNLKRTNLPWEHVYNVDSFQGHEADYVIISVVRTDAAGFLKSTQRMNVMLTRCKRGMIVVTSQQFLRTAGVNILLGKLAQHWVSQIGTVATWTDSRLIINREADMPGVPGKPAFASPPNSLGRVASIASSPCLTAAQLYSRTPPAAVVAQDRPESPSRTVDDDFPRLPTPRAVIGGSGRTVSRNLVNAQITPSMARLTVQKSMAEPPQVCVSPVIRGPTAFPALSGAGGRQLQGRWRSQSDSVKSWRARA